MQNASCIQHLTDLKINFPCRKQEMATLDERKRDQYYKVANKFWECYQKEDESVDKYFRRLMRLYKKMKRLYWVVDFDWNNDFKLILQFTSGLKVKEVNESLNDWFIWNYIPRKTTELRINIALRMARELEAKHLNANPDKVD